ncbi:hypothetical protein [Gorillibacterium sp. sgz5001074]|uniref:hypothetical protein n=1 Tax=Gorillibacterium sp. sgz5001074 TaxID=3446695 RepID=UPI003F67D15F
MTKEELQGMIVEAKAERDEAKAAFYLAQLKNLEDGEEKAAEVLAGFQLPQDYDAITGLPGMNAEVQSLINQVSEQLTAVHAEHLQQVHTDHKAAMEQLNETVSDLTERLRTSDQALAEALQKAEENFKLAEENRRLYSEESYARKDAEQKRDAAVRATEEVEAVAEKTLAENRSLKAQIDELEGMVRTLKNGHAPTGGLQLKSTLRPETEEERKARLEKARLEQINRNLVEKFGLQPLKMPGEAPAVAQEEEVTEERLDDAFRGLAEDQDVARDVTGGEGVQEVAAALEDAGDAPAGITLEAIVREIAGMKVRITKLEDRVEAVY